MYRLTTVGTALALLLHTASGYAFELNVGGAALALSAAALLPFAILLKGLRIEFGRSHLLWGQILVEALASVTALSGPYTLIVMVYSFHSPLMAAVIYLFGVGVSAYVFQSFGGRGGCVVVQLAMLIFRFGDGGRVPFRDRYAAEFPVPRADQLGHVVFSLYVIASIFVKYRKDRLTLVMAGAALGLLPGLGGHFASKRLYSSLLRLLVVMVCLYLVKLWARRFRRLPPSLEGCKFVKLGYLRAVAQDGSGIRRCQECPPEAFGDPRKAQHIVVVSHRWLDRFTCDVRTGDCPEGFRLRTMLERLDLFFSTKACGRGGRPSDKFRRFCSGLTNGNDVLLFFDFMSLPQVGKDAAGNILDRTPEEDSLFKRCLPHMGMFYSMFPVLVCEEVPEGVHSYSESGWCFSELTIAALGCQLKTYSASAASGLLLPRSSSRFEGEGVSALKKSFEAALHRKTFFAESDRPVVQGLFDGFLLKARLMNAILAKNMPALSSALEQIQGRQLASLLDQPVNFRLDTPLHLAVAGGFAEAVETLISHGANPRLRNLRGDTCFQIWLFPRCSRTARLCAVSFRGSAALQDEHAWEPGSALDGEDGGSDSEGTSSCN